MTGKAARNEVRKIQATYLNNIGVGLLVAGVVVPAFAFWNWAVFLTDRDIEALKKGEWTDLGLAFNLALLAAAYGLAFFISRRLNGRAKEIVSELED
jgi:hypothetical protein